MATSSDDSYIEKLVDETSYQIWKFQITVCLKAYDIYDIVDGTTLLSSQTTKDDRSKWNKNDARAQKLIVTSIDKKHMMHIIDCKTSKEMFDKIKTIFEKSSAEQICHLWQDFYSYNYIKGTDISTHIGKIENTVHKLKSLGQTIDETMVISKILSSLPSNYKYFQTAWESTPKTEKTLELLTARLLSEENRNKEDEVAVAFKTTERKVSRYCKNCKTNTHDTKYCRKTNSNKEIKCYRCGLNGHKSNNCINTKQEQCTICKKTNHAEKDCFFRNKHSSTSKENNRKVAFLTENSTCNYQDFVVDSGSSSHMVNDKNLFNTIEESYSNIKVAKKNENMTAEGKGDVEGKSCILKNVLYVPELSKNLLSVNAITENDGEVIFTKEKVIIKKNEVQILEGIKKDSGLYMVNINKFEESYFTKDVTAEDWHRRLGHLGVNNMKKLIDLSTGMKLTKKECEIGVCEPCVMAKQVRLPFKTIRQRAKRPLEILHTDVCGPIDPVTWDGKKYILTVLDDYTHYTRVYLLKYKSEVTEYLKEFIAEAETYHSLKVSKIRCDNGGEYVSLIFKEYCRSKGIVIDYTIPETPELNGKAERLNRTLLEKSRALIFDSNINKELWGEATYVAAFLLNRSPTETADKTPIEKWTGNKPDLSRLQIFGSVAYAKVLGYKQKLEPRSKRYIFVGYAPVGYRLWDEQLRKIIISRDVIFKTPEVKTRDDNRVKINLKNEEKDNTENDLITDNETTSEKHSEEETENEQDQAENNENMDLSLGEGSSTMTRSGRKVTKPDKLKDYVTDFKDEVFLTYQEAVQGEEKDKWISAIEEEKQSLIKNQTWTYVNSNDVKNKRILTSKWVFRIKDSGKYKARLVIRGCQQKSGMDYGETFSPVISTTSIRLLFALAVKNNMKITKFDIKTAFLYGNLSEEIYMQVPEGFENMNIKNKVCKLEKSLYGLKQAPLKWNERLTGFLRANGLHAILSDQCIFINENKTLYLAIYVDDGLLLTKTDMDMKKLITKLRNEFEMTTEENPNQFLGVTIERQENKIFLNQQSYVQATLEKFNMQNAKSVSTPMNSQEQEVKCMESNTSTKPKYPYREAVGSLLYLSNKCRPDITYAVNICTRKMEDPTDTDIVNIKRIFRYLVSTQTNGISYNNSECDKIIAYCDSDFAGDKESRKSTTGYIIFYCGGPLTWCSRKQAIVSLSSTEAEYIAAAECLKEIVFLKTMIEELTSDNLKVELFIDNQSAISLIKNGQFNRRSKHIDVRYHFINEKFRDGFMNLNYCASDNQIADILTKPLGNVKFQHFKEQFMTNGL